MRIYTCAPTPPVPRPAWASAAGSRATTPPGPIRHSAIGRPMRSTNHRRSRGLLRHRSVWQHDRHYSPQGDRPELRSLSRLSKLGGPAQSNLARQPRQARNDAGHGGGGERNPGRDHPAARCLVHEEVPDRRCPHARRHRHRPGDTAYEPPPPGKPGRPRKYGDRITREKLRTLTQTHTELPIYGSHRTVRYRTAVCRARFLGGRPVRAVWLSMFVDGKWTAEGLLLYTDPGQTVEDVIISLRWTIEPMFAALKGGEGMIDMWM